MHAISSYRGNRPTPTHTYKQTYRQDRLQYTAPQLARSVNMDYSIELCNYIIYIIYLWKLTGPKLVNKSLTQLPADVDIWVVSQKVKRG